MFVDYRYFDAKNITPRFEFGFGLSYTQFQYSGLSITPVEDDAGQDEDGQLEANWLAAKPGPRGVGSSTALWLHRPAYTVSFTVQNGGQVAGTEVRLILSLSRFNRFIVRACEPKIDIAGILAFPIWRRRAALSPTWFHRHRVATWRVEDCQCDAFEVRPVGLGRVQSDMGACARYVLSFGWREQSRFQVEGHVTTLIEFYSDSALLIWTFQTYFWTFGRSKLLFFLAFQAYCSILHLSFEQHSCYHPFEKLHIIITVWCFEIFHTRLVLAKLLIPIY